MHVTLSYNVVSFNDLWGCSGDIVMVIIVTAKVPLTFLKITYNYWGEDMLKVPDGSIIW